MAPMSLDLVAQLDRSKLPSGKESEVKCALTVRADTALAAAAPVDTSICLVFDCSASMQGEKLETAIDAAKMVVKTMDPRHSISLVGFQSRTHVLIDNAKAGPEEKETVSCKIDQIRD